ncbi:hypothetical protein [Micromonospora violae]|uniref:hypothetical protein n=1 Tax=Micromonospora violae TaxID=1278207 RepID=UPI001FC99D99|nr:hypothetical protein [Micromonospora violae]
MPIVEVAGDSGDAEAGEALGEHPLHMRCSGWARFQPVGHASPFGVCPVRVRARVGQPVAVGRSATEMTALLDHLGAHRRLGPKPGALDLSFGVHTEQGQQRQVELVAGVDRAVEFGQPQLHAVQVEQRREVAELVAVERSPTSKNSATITPRPSITSSAKSRCHRADDNRSWNSRVDIRP